MKLLRATLVAFLLLLLAPAAVRAATLPTDASLSLSSGSITWPGSPKFDARFQVSAGPAGADFTFAIRPASGGLPLADGQAELDGPGNLNTSMAIPGPAGPGHCSRAAGGNGIEYSYQLSLAANSSTTVVIPMTLVASRLAGMDPNVLVRYHGDIYTHYREVSAPLAVAGPEGVSIEFEAERPVTRSLMVPGGKAFRLSGSTSPVLANAEIRIKADPVSWIHEARMPRARWISATTGDDGTFRTRPVRFGQKASWLFTAHPVTSQYDRGKSCGPTVEVEPFKRKAYKADLIGRSFRSTLVRGTDLIQDRELSMGFRIATAAEAGSNKHPFWPVLELHAGCNSQNFIFRLKDGRLTIGKMLISTAMACSPDRDPWISRQLRRGLDARIVGRKLVLTGRSGVRIALRDRHEPSLGRAPALDSLLGYRYRSIKVKGNRMIGNRELRIDFFMHSTNPELPDRPTLLFGAGCNANGSRFLIRNGRLIAYGGFTGTVIGCTEDPDSWIARKLNRGMKIRARGRLIILSRPNQSVRLVLRRVGITRFG